MVDSRKGDVMLDRIDSLADDVNGLKQTSRHLTERVDHLTDKVDHLTGRVDHLTGRVDHLTGRVDHLTERVDNLSSSVDERFDAVDAAIREQREYTEFAYLRIDKRFDQLQLGFGRLEAKVDERLDRFERKLDAVIDAPPGRRGPKPNR